MVMARVLVFVLAAALCQFADARAEVWRCDPAVSVICAAAKCQSKQPTVWLILDFDSNRYQRCDAKGCDAYEMTVVPSGLFLNVNFHARTLFNATIDGSQYVEVTTSEVSTFSQFGACTTQR